MKESTTKSDKKPYFNPFEGPDIDRVLYTTQPQAEIWVACKFGGIDANRAYNESVTLILKGALNSIMLLNAIQSLVDRHEALRSVFSTDGRFMTIFKHLPATIDQQNLSELSEAEKDTTLKTYLTADANYNFDLVKGPLFKVALIKLSETEHHLILTAHHIICDGWSIGIMLEELGSLYTASVLNTNHSLPKPESFYAYSDDQQTYLISQAHKDNENFWLKQFKDSVPQLTMPVDFPRPELRTFKSERLDFALDSTLLDALKKTGVKAGCSFVTTLLSVFEVFISAQTGQNDIVLGLPSADQAASGKTQMIGHCVNLLPLRSQINVHSSFSDYLKKRKSELFDAYEHQKLSFGELLQKLNIGRDPSRVPLVPVVFNIDVGMTALVSFSGLSYQLKSNPRTYETFELFLNATGSAEYLNLEWQYNSNLFKPETIKMMMASFEEIINTIVANPDIEIGDIVKVDGSAYLDLNKTQSNFPQLPLHVLLAKQAKNTPLNTALKFQDSEISYENLGKKAHQLAHCLVDKGIKPGDYIAVLLPKSIELVVVLMAIMECGAAYLPLDPNYPSKRLKFMLDDSEAKFIITTSSLSHTNVTHLHLEDLFLNLSTYSHEPLAVRVDNDKVAYLLYTSGSTGKPKGVPITHKSLVNLLFSVIESPGVKETDTLISITSISFDIAMSELFAPLLTGAKLILTNEETAKDTRLLLDLIKNEFVTMMQATPTTWQMLLDSGWEEHLPLRAISTGEALPLGLAKNILARVDELWNMYGPTETTIWSAYKQIANTDEFIAIGRPLANTQLYIVNNQGKLVAPGKVGELCIAGDGVAKGYWKRPNLTAEKFIKHPFKINSRSLLYRTGDLAKLLPSGEIQCLGRIDQQIKIRGQRIELGEIEQALDLLEGINSSVVLLNKDRLVANIITSKNENQNTDRIKAWKEILKEQLPEFMIPYQFNLVDEFPTTLNGKIDRNALLKLLPNKNSETNYTKPSTEAEKIILAIWQECLGLDKISVDSDFFEIGGHSLVGVKVMTKLEKETGNRLPLVALLKHSTVKKLAAYMESEFFTWDSLVPLKPEGNKPPLYIVHGSQHHVIIFNELAQKLHKDQPVYGLQSRGLDGVNEPHDSIYKMAEYYNSEIVASNPEGPYALAGFSYGGIVAFEMARQLQAQGREVKILAQFDTYVFPQYYYINPLKKKIVSILYLMGKIVYVFLNAFSSKKNFKRRMELIKLQISGLFLRLKYGKEKQHEIQFNVSSKLSANHNKATNQYTIVPHDIVVDLFRAKEEVNFVHDHKFLGWKKIARKGIRKHMVPGNHVDMFEKPQVEDFATSLQYVLDTHNSESYE